MTGILSATFLPPKNRDERPRGIGDRRPEVLDLFLHQQTRPRTGLPIDFSAPVATPSVRSVGAVRGPERIVHIDTSASVGEFFALSAGSLASSASVNRVFSSSVTMPDFGRTHGADPKRVALGRARQRDRRAQKLRQPVGHGLKRVLRGNLPLGTT